ncbi:Xaa-Pro peptidase family protein [Mesorhizobium sp. BAC0120]|uniref:M24 family metallopeptidase n=1 Tax=Mesorhizobium sp. BAC0120 TaxID=3090670 RepID=UPI00298CB31C|nr:Xaa-Pro peptidase family protein [Mesorhizobium sp. BAC0120]MDW6023296.1 Xaa-Pro peptidase family protein [Mesorhizobium sp. BAC0120]
MNDTLTMTELASELRSKAFGEMPDDIDLIVSSESANKAYLSGYVSMAHDLAPSYRSAVLATRDCASLVVSAADAGPAFDLLRDPGLIYRYGEFYFETAGGGEPKGYNVKPKAAFEDAAADALRSVKPSSGRVGIDRADGDLLWNLGRDFLGEDKVVDVTSEMRASRATKTTAEVKRLRRATVLVEEGFQKIIDAGHAGMTELDLAAMVSERMVAGGGVPRFVSVTSGPRSALADAYATPRKIAEGELIRIDAGCTVDGYWSDLGRTFVFGEPDTRQSKTYQAILAGIEDELAAVKAGVAANKLFEIAVSSVKANGIPHYKRQHCGHGIGLRAYDSPVVNSTDRTTLLAGMCLCLETPYYELNLDGMMVEDTIQVTSDGYEPLTTISRELFVIP